MLALWRTDPDFVRVREPDEIKKFGPGEREEWASLWNGVGRALRE